MDNYPRTLALNLLAYAAARDLSPEKLCASAGIDIEKLEGEPGYNPGQEKLERLWPAAVSQSKDELFGLHFGESLQLAALGVVGQLSRNSRTAGAALSNAAGLTSMLTRLFRMEVKSLPQECRISFHRVPGNKGNPAARQILDFLMVFVVHELDGLLLNKIQPLKVEYEEKPALEKEYIRVFRCHPVFGTGSNLIVLPGGIFDRQLIGAEYGLQEFLTRRMAASPPQPSHPFRDKILHYLRTNSYLGLVTINAVAANFNLSVRTLQRRLAAEGFQFQDLADEVRKSLAIDYMENGEFPLKEISFMLGYNELSAFTRSFKRWTGHAPSDYLLGNSKRRRKI